MNAPIENSDRAGVGRSGLDARIQSLTARIEAQAASHQRKSRGVMIGGGLLVVLSLFSLSWTTEQIRSVDAEALLFQGRMQLEQGLPEGRAALEATLKEDASKLISDGFDALFDALPDMRRWAAAEALGSLDGSNEAFEYASIEYMQQAITDSRLRVEAAFPNEENKHERLIQAVVDAFTVRVSEGIDELYPFYEERMVLLNDYLSHLLEGERADLSQGERRRRDLIVTLLQLVNRANEHGA